jgi:5'-nucleotidase
MEIKENARQLLLLFFALLLSASSPIGAQIQKEVHILSANDMHAKLGAFPALADVADSLRTLYPGLLIFSAGDNRTGDPLNDMYDIPAYPMVALMNQVGFDATTLGNHEFDSGTKGLARLIGLSNFSYICANMHPADSLGIHLLPTKLFDVEGIRVGVVGAVQLGTHGLPDTHPDNCRGISFAPVNETVAQYEWLRRQCDVCILLSHNGYEEDVESSALLPWLDLIIGGHTHTQIGGGETHNGVLITQNVNRLRRVTHTTIILERDADSQPWRIVRKKADLIDLERHQGRNKVVQDMVRFFSDNPAFHRALATVEQPFGNYEELGCMMTDAFVEMTGSDIGIENYGGVRFGEHPAGPFTLSDVLSLDPFGNFAVVMELTGLELHRMLINCCDNDGHNFPYVSGVRCQVEREPKDSTRIKRLTLLNRDGSKFNLKKTYRVVTNNYVSTICDAPRHDQGTQLNKKTSDLIISFLEKRGSVNYKGVSRITEIKK